MSKQKVKERVHGNTFCNFDYKQRVGLRYMPFAKHPVVIDNFDLSIFDLQDCKHGLKTTETIPMVIDNFYSDLIRFVIHINFIGGTKAS